MFNFDEPRYEKVVSDALALRPQIEAAVDKVCEQGYSNIFFIGCGGTLPRITSPRSCRIRRTQEITMAIPLESINVTSRKSSTQTRGR